MSFSTFQINDLPDDSEDDYQLEFTSSEMMIGIQMSEGELIAVAQAMLDAAGGDWDRWDGAKAQDVAADIMES